MSSLVSPELEAQAIAWRRHLHAHPELSFEEHETAAWVRARLEEIGGFEIETPTPTSVVARLRGPRPGRTVALRADLDALPITEENTFDFVSTRPGVMHACGHDGHTAMLLGAARILADRRDELAGEARLVFQHAEETPPGGAAELVAKGVLDGVDLVIGAHLISRLEAGKVGVRPGPFMASADMFEIDVRGRGGHAGFPHTSVDPVVIAAQVVVNLQQLVAREADPLDSVVVSVTRIAGGTTSNVIPETVSLGGTVRTFSEAARAAAREGIERVVRGITDAHRAAYAFTWIEGYGPVINDEAAAAAVEAAARAELGDENVVPRDPIMAGEDFSAYLRAAPGAFFNVGAMNAAIGADFPHHHPRFTIDESALRAGIAVLARVALDTLEARG